MLVHIGNKTYELNSDIIKYIVESPLSNKELKEILLNVILIEEEDIKEIRRRYPAKGKVAGPNSPPQ